MRQMLDIFLYIARDDPQAAERVRDRIYDVIAFVARYPRAGHATMIPGLRVMPVGTYPYVVLFRWDEKRRRVRIVRVLHGARRRPALREDQPEFRLAAMS